MSLIKKWSKVPRWRLKLVPNVAEVLSEYEESQPAKVWNKPTEIPRLMSEDVGTTVVQNLYQNLERKVF